MSSKGKFTEDDIDLRQMKGENSTKKYRWRDRKIEKENQKYLQGLVEYDNEGKIIDKPIPPSSVILAFILNAIITLFTAMGYAELGSAMPSS